MPGRSARTPDAPASEPFTAGESLPIGECWICGALTSSLYSAVASINSDAPVGPSWCEECQVIGEFGSLQQVKDRLLDRVKVLMRERLADTACDAGARSATDASVGQAPRPVPTPSEGGT